MNQLKKKIIESNIFSIYENEIDENILYKIKINDNILFTNGITIDNIKYTLLYIVEKNNLKYIHFKNKCNGMIFVLIGEDIIVLVYFDEYLPYQYDNHIQNLFNL